MKRLLIVLGLIVVWGGAELRGEPSLSDAEGTGRANVDYVSVRPAGKQGMGVVATVAVAEPAKDSGAVNLALGKPYVFSRAPSYSYCTDKDDKIQLTDGKYTTRYFWTQKSTVGWNSSGVISITVDLGKEAPISGFSFNTAFGRADVTPPLTIQVYVSNDSKAWYYVGDLYQKNVAARGTPNPSTYQVYRVSSNDMPCRGRWVAFLVEQTPYCFVDEVEVYRGPDALLAKTMASNVFATPMDGYFHARVVSSLELQLAPLAAAVEAIPAASPLRAEAIARLSALRAKLKMPLDEFSVENLTVVPVVPVQRELFALNSFVLRARGFVRPIIWRNCRWENLVPTEMPPKEFLGRRLPEPVVVEMMRGEVRAEAFNILNPTDTELEWTLRIEGLPADANVDLREVLYTDTAKHKIVSGALKPGKGTSLTTKIPAGTSRQIWLSYHRPTLAAKPYRGRMKAECAGQPSLELPVVLVIHDFDFPKQPTLHVGGWDYVNGGGKYYNPKGPGNLKSNMAIMRDMYVDSPWGTGAVAPSGAKFDAEGRLTNAAELNFKNWDEWVALWSGARIYCVFTSYPAKFYGEQMGTPRFNKMVGDYYTAWVKHMKKQGLKASQLLLLIQDEPYSHERDEIIIPWAKAIKAAQPDIIIFEDPIYQKPEDAIPEMYAVSDVLCPNHRIIIKQGQPYMDFFLKQQAAGKELWLYSCSGPSRLLDPIGYYRAQEWRCFQIGGFGTFYWALGCGGGIGDSWHAYKQPGTEYSPYFVSHTDTMESKQSEAIREGVQDFEYFTMLAKRVSALKAKGVKNANVDAAVKLLARAPEQALDKLNPQPLEENSKDILMQWSYKRDRTIMDTLCVEALRLLTALK